jgi:hypothetical protein
MSTEVLEQVHEEIHRKPTAELLEMPAIPAESTVRETPRETVEVTTPPPVGECDVLVESTLIAPVSLRTHPFIEGWNLVQDKGVRKIEQELTANGWHFFYVVPGVRRTAMSRRPENAIRKALGKVLENAFAQSLNTIEIASVRVSELFGIHRAEVVARLRHIQESPYLFVSNEEMRQRMLRVGARAGLLHLRPWHRGRNYIEYKPF